MFQPGKQGMSLIEFRNEDEDQENHGRVRIFEEVDQKNSARRKYVPQ